MDSLLNLLFPPECLFCESVGEVICNKCLENMPLALSTNCIRCNKPTITGKTHYECAQSYIPREMLSIYQYKGPIRTVIRKSKYEHKEFALLRKVVKHGIKVLKERGVTLEKKILLVPIPISTQRRKERGFNQVEIITNLLAYEFGLDTNKIILQRIKDTKPQYSNNREERFKNVQNAFCIKNEKLLRGKKIMLVDDVSTSGATLLEACKAFYNKGIYDVSCLVIAKKFLRD